MAIEVTGGGEGAIESCWVRSSADKGWQMLSVPPELRLCQSCGIDSCAAVHGGSKGLRCQCVWREREATREAAAQGGCCACWGLRGSRGQAGVEQGGDAAGWGGVLHGPMRGAIRGHSCGGVRRRRGE